MPRITESNERMVYQAVSESNPSKVYRIDLLANGGAGRCSCTDFGTRRQPALDKGMQWHTRETECKHLREAIRLFNVALFRRMSNDEDRSLE